MDKAIENIGLCTFPDNDENYCKYFEISKDLLIDILVKLDRMGEKGWASIEDFLDNYTWDETFFVYLYAKNKKKILCESEEE